MKRAFKYIGVLSLTVWSLLAVQPAFADCGNLPPCPGYADDAPGDTCCPVAVPFDGGITLMLAAGGIGMGVRAMRKRKGAQ